jgi:predicted RNA-binding protein with PIN domain
LKRQGKTMLYLIDGYNLLHAMGILGGRLGPEGLSKARLGLLGLLRGALKVEASSVTVVFDAAGAPPGLIHDQECQGIHVRFAIDQEQADDLIESMIHKCPAPKQLGVVSDDRRIRKAAQRRGCIAVGCADFLEELARRRHGKRSTGATGADHKPSAKNELDFWLQEFAHLDDEKEMKELFQPFNFGEL